MTIERHDHEGDPGLSLDETCDVSKFQRRPPGTGYRVSKVPKSYADQVQLTSVLRHLYGKLRTDADVIAATAWLLFHWRRKAVALAEVEWGPLGAPGDKSRLPNALGCPVAFVMTYDKKQGRKPCGMPTLCPFCWAREVRRHWLKIDAAFFPPVAEAKPRRRRPVDTGPPTPKSTSSILRIEEVEKVSRSPYDLVRRVFTFRVPEVVIKRKFDRNGKLVETRLPAMGVWLDSRIRGVPDPRLHRRPECSRLMAAAGPPGGLLESIWYRRLPDGQGDEAGWEVRVYQLVLAADGDALPKELHPMATAEPRTHIVIKKPNRATVVSALARAILYPRDLVDPHAPLDRAIDYLDARRGRRLIANYGCFRGRDKGGSDG